jgi:chromate transporter
MDNPNAYPQGVTFAEALRVWARIGLLSFGGPAGQIALMHREIVEERGWLTEKEYLSALNFCMLLPGPEAMQLATYAGWKLHGTRGGLAAGLLFVLPGAFVVLALTMLYAGFGQLPLVEALFYGIKAAVLAIVVEALVRVARRAIRTTADWVIAGLAFLALFAFGLPFPIVIIAAGAYGFWRSNGVAEEHTGDLPSWQALGRTVSLWGAVWLVPLAALALFLGPRHVLTEVGVFFSKLAIVTFGGAYAVLAYMAQAAVETQGWLSAAEMIDGLALAETTPGPLILVTQFVGYFAGLREMGSVWGGIAGAAVTLWMTFAPCFLWIFAGAPYMEAIGRQAAAVGRARRDHGGGRGRHPEPLTVVRASRAVRAGGPDARLVQAVGAGMEQSRRVLAGFERAGRGGAAAVPLRHHPDADVVRGDWCGVAAGVLGLTKIPASSQRKLGSSFGSA